MDQPALYTPMSRLKTLGCDFRRSLFQNHEIHYSIILPDRPLSDSELEEIFLLIVENFEEEREISAGS